MRQTSGYAVMRATWAVFAVVLVLGCSTTTRRIVSPDENLAALPSTQPSPRSLSEHPVIGLLGLPLGTVTNVHATIIAGSELRLKAYDGLYLLRVTAVDGHRLGKAATLEFTVPSFANVRLARDPLALYELKTGNKKDQLRAGEIAELERGYVGSERSLMVYETGGYSGIPNNLPRDIPSWQDHSFSFTTSLVVLMERP